MGRYEERAELLVPFAKCFGAVGSYNDPAFPDYLVVYVETPVGQMSWHIHPDDVHLFDWLTIVPEYPWDLHTTREKYERMHRLTALIPQGVLTYANPRLDAP